MHRFTRAVGALVISTLVSAGLVVGLSTPARALDLCASTGGLLSGSGAVGSPLDVALPEWDLGLLASSVDWLRGGTPFRSGSSSYTPTAADVGQALQVRQGASLQLPVVGTVECSWVSNAIVVTDEGPGDPGDPGDPTEVLSALIDPILNGNPAVGSLLTVTAPVWSLPGVSTTYQWLRDGVAIPGADGPSYVPTLDDAGHQLSASVSGALLGIPGLTVVTDSLGIPLSSGSTVSPASDVAVTGAKKIGTVLALTGPTWDPADATSSYQWLRDDAPIAGATAATYKLVPADLGHGISVKVTGHKEGWTDNTITSDPVTPAIGDAIQFVIKPRLTGTGKVGRLLTADPGVWGGAGEDGAAPAFSYQWSRNGVAIPGAVAQTYQAQLADAGKSLSVTVRATRPAYKPGTFTTAGLTVARVVSTLRAKAAKSTLEQGQKAVLALLVKAPGVASPTGSVKVYDKKLLLRTLTLGPGKKGKGTVKLAGLKPGTHKLTVVYAGTASLASATSKVVKLKVIKKKKK